MKKRLFLLTVLLIIISKAIYPSYAQNIEVRADKQNYNGKSNIMSFEGNVKVNVDNVTIKSPKAFLRSGEDGKAQAATFIQGAEATKIDGITKNTVKANIIKVSILENKMKAEGKANSVILENQVPVVTIKSSNQEFDMKNNTITAVENVSLKYKEIVASSNNAKITLDEAGKPSQVNLIGSAKVIQDKNIVSGSNLIFKPITNELIASGNVHSETLLDDSTQVSIWSDYQQFDQNSNTLITSGQVKVTYKDYVATGPKATFLPGPNSKPNKIVFMGRSKIKEGSRIVEADKIEITVDPKNFTAEGNVRSKFTQIQNTSTQTSKNKKKSAPKHIQPVKQVKPKAEPVEEAPKSEYLELMPETFFKQ